MADDEVIETVRAHYVRHWGPPSREAAYSTRTDTIEVYQWDSSDNPEGVAMYATVGSSATAVPGTDAGHRVEYLVGLEPSRDGIVRELAGLGIYATQMGVTIDHGHTVPGDGPLWPGSPMSTFLVLRPGTAILPPLLLPGGGHVEFLQAIPVFESERRFKNEHGAEALVERWEQAGLPFWDPRRAADPKDRPHRPWSNAP